jgi:hypothetical protein
MGHTVSATPQKVYVHERAHSSQCDWRWLLHDQRMTHYCTSYVGFYQGIKQLRRLSYMSKCLEYYEYETQTCIYCVYIGQLHVLDE